MSSVRCGACGARVSLDDGVALTRCPACARVVAVRGHPDSRVPRPAARLGPLLAVVVVAVGFSMLVVCGGLGVAVYYAAFRPTDVPPTVDAESKDAAAVVAAPLVPSAPVPPTPPAEPEDDDEAPVKWPRKSGRLYDVAFPGPFATTKSRLPFANGLVEMDASVHVTADRTTLTFAHYVVPKMKKTKKSPTPEMLLRQTIQTETRRHGASAEVRERSYTPRGGVGRELSVHRKDSTQAAVVRFALVDDDFYVQKVEGEGITRDSSVVRTFLASLQLRRE